MKYRLKIYFTLITLFSVCHVIYAQSDKRTIDSLKVRLSTASSKLEKVGTMLALSKLVGKSDAK